MSGPFDPMSYPARWVQQLRSALPGMALPPMPPQKASPFPPAPPPAPIRRRSKLHIPQSSLVPPDQRRVIVFVSLEHVMHHEIVRVAGLTSHHVRLVNNGELHYAYNAHGELVELIGKNVAVWGSGTPQITVEPLPMPWPPPGSVKTYR